MVKKITREQFTQLVHDQLARLDGTDASAVTSLTETSREDADKLGGFPAER